MLIYIWDDFHLGFFQTRLTYFFEFKIIQKWKTPASGQQDLTRYTIRFGSLDFVMNLFFFLLISFARELISCMHNFLMQVLLIHIKQAAVVFPGCLLGAYNSSIF
jgi:hypothetical protein